MHLILRKIRVSRVIRVNVECVYILTVNHQDNLIGLREKHTGDIAWIKPHKKKKQIVKLKFPKQWNFVQFFKNSGTVCIYVYMCMCVWGCICIYLNCTFFMI